MAVAVMLVFLDAVSLYISSDTFGHEHKIQKERDM